MRLIKMNLSRSVYTYKGSFQNIRKLWRDRIHTNTLMARDCLEVDLHVTARKWMPKISSSRYLNRSLYMAVFSGKT